MNRQLLVLVALLFSLLPLHSTPAGAAGSSSSSASSHTASSAPQEIVSLRNRTSRTYLVDGHYEAHIYPGSVNYQDAQGTWQPIDNTLVPSSATGFAYQNTANSYTVRLPANINAPVRIEKHGSWIQFGLHGANAPGSVANNRDEFKLPGATLSYAPGNDLLKESITLSGPDSPHTFTFALRTAPGLTAKQNASGGIDIVDSAGTIVFSFAPPFLQEHDSPNISRAVTLHLDQAPSGYTVTLSADPTWLADPNRKWPVVIDPTVYTNQAFQDCYIFRGTPTTNDCGTSVQQLDAGYDNTNPYRSLLQFDLSSVPNNVQVLNAEMGLNMYWTSNSTPVALGAYQVTRSWTPSVTWNTANGTTAWTTAGGDYSSTSNYVVNSSVGPATGWVHWYPTAMVQSWVNGSVPNSGLILKEPSESVSNIAAFYSTNYPTNNISAYWPYLTVTYEPWTGLRDFYPLVDASPTQDIGLHVNVANGNLIEDQTDLSMAGIGLPLAVGRAFNSAYTITGLGTGPTEFGYSWLMDTGHDIRLTFFNDGSAAFYGPTGYQIPFGYNNGGFTAPPGIDSTLVKNGDGSYTLTENASQTKMNFTSVGVLSSEQDRAGNLLTYHYNADGTLGSITDTQGRTTTFTYLNGLLTQITDPSSLARTYKYAYDASNNLITYTDPAGGVTKYGYDTNTDLNQITDPNGNITKIGYDGNQRVTSISDPLNKVTSISYTSGLTGSSCTSPSVGYTTVTDPNSHKAVYCYDANGRSTQTFDALSNQTKLGWTPDNQVTSITPPSTQTTSISYDNNSNPTRVQLPTGAAASATYPTAPTGVTGYQYLPNSTTDAEGNTTSYGYTAQGLLSTVTDATNHSTSYGYTQPISVNGTSPYLLASVTDANGHVTSYTYFTSGTSIGLVSQVTPPSPLGAESFTYDSANRIATQTDGKNQQTTYTYDGMDRVTGIAYADGTSVGYVYDKDGNLVAQADATGTTTYTYDADGRLTQETLPNGNSISYGYDPAGNLTSKTDASGTTSYGYDTADRLSSVTDPQNAATSFGYDPNSNLTSVAYPNHVTEGYTYDTADQLTKVADTGCTSGTCPSSTYSYVNPTTSQQTDQRYSVTDASGNVTTYNYDALNRLTQAIQKNTGGTQLASYVYAYDPVGNITSKTINGTQTTYGYNNAADELTSASGGTTATYSYDGNGALIGVTGGNAFAVNAKEQINQITPNGGSPIRESYAGTGQAGRTGSGGTAYQYDVLTGVDSLSTGSSWSITLAATSTRVNTGSSVTLTALANNDVTSSGDVIDIIDQTAGTTVKECTQNAVCSATVSQSTAVKHTYIAQVDPSGSTTAIASSGTIVVTWASGTSWTVTLTAPQATAALGQSVTLTATANQSVTSSGYQVDFVDRNSGSVIASCTTGTSCSTSVSQSAASAHMYVAKVETSGGATVQAASGTWTVTWAPTTYFVSAPSGSVLSERISGATYDYLHDGLGSVVALINSSGGIVNSYAYDPYGNTTSVSETVSNPFRFIGAIWDSSTGLYKMGERYYDPSLGRFTQLDPLGNGYIYSHDDPVDFSDPSGLTTINEQGRGGVSLGGPGEPVNEGDGEPRPSQNSTRGSGYSRVRPPRGTVTRGNLPPKYDPVKGWKPEECWRRGETGCFGDPRGGQWHYHEDNHHWGHWDYSPGRNRPWENLDKWGRNKGKSYFHR